MSSVYVVAKGAYSDYHIVGVYSTKELAEEAVKLFSSDNLIEEFPLDALPAHPPGMYRWYVMMDKVGNWHEASTIDARYSEEHPEINKRWSPHRWSGSVCGRVMNNTRSRSPERRIQLLATGEWDKYVLKDAK